MPRRCRGSCSWGRSSNGSKRSPTRCQTSTVSSSCAIGYRPVTDWSREYDTWTRTTLDTLRGTLNSVRLHAGDFATEQGRIQALQAMSDSAEGRMQALQLGNMMAGEQLQQLVKLRQLVMA